MKENFLSYKLSKELGQVITKYDLPVGAIYWVLKSIFVEVEKMYFDQVQKEIEELQEEKADERDNDVDNE